MTDTPFDQKSFSASASASASGRFDRMLFEKLPIGLAVCDMEGKLVYINEAFAAIIGYNVNEALKLTYWEVTPKEFEAQEQEQLASLRETGRYGPYEKKYIHKDGRHLPVRLSGVLIRDNDQDYIWSSVENITAQKKMEEALHQSQERLSLHMENTPLGVISWDKDFNCIQWNPAAEKIFGFTPEEALGGNALKLLVPEEINDQIDGIFEALLSQAGGGHSINENVTKDGRTILCEWFNTPLKGEDGVPVGVASIVRDITSEKEQEKELREAKEDAETANKAKSEFLASMSHELRTPLNAVLGFAQMLQFDPHTPLSRTQNEHVECILSGGKHLLELVNEVLDLAKIEADQFDLSLEEVNANEVVAECVALSIPIGESRDISIINKFSDRPLSRLRTDRLRFKQSLLNLVSNAVKYNRDGGAVTVDGRETDDGFLRISVTDTGVGIAEEQRSNVFQMFHRLGADPEIAREGTGIGLTVTKLLVERMAGLIGFDSEENVGSTFWIKLPLVSNENVLIWTDAMRIGVDAIDKDHQIIISLVNRISHREIDEVGVDKVIKELIDYTHYHFRREEAVMQACDYPDLDKHRDMHKSLTDQVNGLADTWRSERDPEFLHRFRKFLRDWLFVHIMKTDAEIAKYTRGRRRDIQAALESLEDT